jgi:uncharacterized membrane protein YeaQ/YmgE (transglycosylase-associated protein family)
VTGLAWVPSLLVRYKTAATRSIQEATVFVSFSFLYIILVGLVAGWATGKIMKGSGYGILMDIVLGIAGAIVGGGIIRFFGFYTSGGLMPAILVAILGAVVLVALVRMLKKA